MTDRISKRHRSWNMSRIKSKNTKPEKAVRSLLHRLGYRFRLHVSYLPGKPDIVLPKYRKVIFVHGCYWHRHPGCKFAYIPKSNKAFWIKKLRNNIRRHKEVERKLNDLNWSVLIVWECELDHTEKLKKDLNRKLEKMKK